MDAQSGALVPGDSDGPDPDHRLILSAASGPVERELIERWAAAEHPAAGPVEVIELGVVPIGRRLERGDDPLLVPVRIAWLPKERDGRRELNWADLLALRDPRRPRRRSQSRIVERDAERYRIVVGEPARASELRRRFQRHSADVPDGTTAFGAFVFRQATLALERAERAVLGDRYKVPRLVVEEITTGARYRGRVQKLAARLGLPPEQVAERAEGALQELVAVQSRLAVDLFGTAMRPLHARAWNVRAQADQLDKLRDLNRRSALIFLPSHRSYADTLVLSDVLHDHDFPRNHVVGGDNLAVWPFAPLARRAGLVFIRRSFRDDAVYKLAIQEYFGYLVAKRFNLEWYLEGGRSRTGKLRPPKFGLLSYVAGALRNEPGLDVQLVPVSITYERLPEVTSMAAEQKGVAKEREGLGWLARYARGQRRPAGDAVVRFGQPISMRERLRPVPGDQSGAPVPRDQAGAPVPDDKAGAPVAQDDQPAQRLALNKLAFEVAVGINRATPVLPASLVTLALLGVRDRALTLDQVRQILAPLLDYVDARGLPESGTSLLRHPGRVAAVLDDLDRADVVTSYSGGDERVYSITPGQHLVAAFYRNNSIHWFVNRAIVELAMIAVAERGSERGSERAVAEAWSQALRLRDLLKFEFFFPAKNAFRVELIDELELMDPKWADHAGSTADVRSLLASSGFLVAHRVLRSFVEAELVVAERLAGHGGHALIDEKSFLAECAGTGQQMLLQGRVHSAEALSGELFGTALRLAAGRNLLQPGVEAGLDLGTDLSTRRQAFAGQVREVAGWISVAAGIDDELTPD